MPNTTAIAKKSRFTDKANPPPVIRYTITIVGNKFTITVTMVLPEDCNKLNDEYLIGNNNSKIMSPVCTLRPIHHVTNISIVENNVDASTK